MKARCPIAKWVSPNMFCRWRSTTRLLRLPTEHLQNSKKCSWCNRLPTANAVNFFEQDSLWLSWNGKLWEDEWNSIGELLSGSSQTDHGRKRGSVVDKHLKRVKKTATLSPDPDELKTFEKLLLTCELWKAPLQETLQQCLFPCAEILTPTRKSEN